MKAFNFKSKHDLSFSGSVRNAKLADEGEEERKDAEKGSETGNDDPDNEKKEAEDAKAQEGDKKESVESDMKAKAADESDENDKAVPDEQDEVSAQEEQKILDCRVYGDIGAPAEEGGEETSAAFARMLDEAGDIDEVRMSINSAGGDVFSAIAIVNQLRAKGCRSIAYVDGLAASAASVLAISADETIMRAGAFLMIHNSWSIAIGDVETMKAAAQQLEKVDGTIAKMYARASEKEEEEIVALMAAETWMDDKEAVKEGFADRVEGTAKAQRANNKLVYNSIAFDISKFKNRPKDFDLLPKAKALPAKAKPAIARVFVKKPDDKALESAREKAVLAERKRVADLDSIDSVEVHELIAAAKADGRTKADILAEAFEKMRQTRANGAALFLSKRAAETAIVKSLKVAPAEIVTPTAASRKKAEIEEAARLIANSQPTATRKINVNGNSEG